ncbi:DUF2169 domain-containing protein [Sorangium sp. So ce1151]|uniref:DUF2169 domain-containing protein n=1 Tax=Sorangium sp. So ce1151 TaxID=3133332 RepID=UPI003F6027E0
MSSTSRSKSGATAPGPRTVSSAKLENLHPEHPRLVTSLPGLRPRALAERASGGQEELALLCDTLWIDADRGLPVP